MVEEAKPLCLHCVDPAKTDDEELIAIWHVFGKRVRDNPPISCWRDREGKLIPIARKCPICSANGYRKGLVDENLDSENVTKDFNSSLDLVSLEAYKAGFETGVERRLDSKSFAYPPVAVPPTLYESLTSHPEHHRFDVPKDQFGEVYHALVAALLLGKEWVAVSPGELTSFATQTKDLLDFYSIPGRFKEERAKSAVLKGKDTTTRVIAEYFKTNEQSDLFGTIRDYLNKKTMPVKGIEQLPFAKYATQSYLGKYWINRYLTITDQLSTAKHSHRLPKYGDVERIAVINIRRGTETSAGRVMEEDNLKACIATVMKANEIVNASHKNESIFTHIVLYGDILAPEARRHVEVYQKDKNCPEIIYISRPWEPKPSEEKKLSFSDDKKLNAPVDKKGQKSYVKPRPKEPPSEFKPSDNQKLLEVTQNFWAEFRGDDKLPFPEGQKGPYFDQIPDGVPLQVRILSIFLALQERYKSKICFIGFRSGFLDGAAFVGIPTFYLDDSVWDTVKKDKLNPGRFLYQQTLTTVDNGNPQPRMVAAGNAINTFIRIDVEKVDGKVVLNSPEPRLASALYMYMLADNATYWDRRCELLGNANGQKKLEALYRLAMRSCS